MRFERGSEVEVLKQVDVLTAWCGGKIVSGDGNTYNVRYDCYVPEHGVDTESVPRKLIRPCPPVQRIQSWVAGDVVEVFDDVMWKTAIVSNVRGAYYIVRLLGSSYKLRVHLSDIRVRQCWHNDQWSLMGKGSRILDKYHKMSLEAAQTNEVLTIKGEAAFLAKNNTGLRGSHIASSRTLKRGSPYCSSRFQTYSRNGKKIRPADKADRTYQALPVCGDQVHAVTYPREYLGEMYMHASNNNKTNGYNELDREELNDFIGCSVARDTESNDSDTDICSVGSCSAISRTLNKFPTHMLAVSCQETQSHSSDAESYCGTRNDEGCDLPTHEDIAACIHSLEVHAYRRTLEALYASGPLSWEKEGLLTNLRIMLYISNDEHLAELTTLISGGTHNIC